MKRKKILIAFFVVIFLVACGNNEETVSAETSSTEEVVSDEGEVVEAEADDAEIEETITEPERVQPDETITDEEESEGEEAPIDFSFTSAEEYLETVPVISNPMPNTDWSSFIEYINSFDITETVIIFDDAVGGKYMIYSGYPYAMDYYAPIFHVYSPEKEIVAGYVTGENGQELEGEFSCSVGEFIFCVAFYYDGDIFINVEYSDGTTEELVVHFVDVYNQ